MTCGVVSVSTCSATSAPSWRGSPPPGGAAGGGPPATAGRGDNQPAGAAAALVDARRVRAALRALAERGTSDKVRADALAEINRVLGRSAGTRRVEPIDDGSLRQRFVPVGDAFAGLMIPVVESAAQSLVDGDLPRVRRCADARCPRVFFDA